MKLNWGTGIFLVIALFLVLCAVFLIYSTRQSISFVEDDYYPKELRHEEKLVKMRRVDALKYPFTATVDHQYLIIGYPLDLKDSTLKGTLLLYRPSDETLDLQFPVNPDTAMLQRIGRDKLKSGRYVIKAEWMVSGQSYYKELDIYIP